MSGTVVREDGVSRDQSSDPVRSSSVGGDQIAGDDHRPQHPIRTGAITWVVAFIVLAAVIVGLGLLLTHVWLPGGVQAFDTQVSHWFVRQRTPTLDTVTFVGSTIGSTGVIIAGATIAVIVLAVGKHGRQMVYVIAALTLEAGVCLLASTTVGRTRPMVPRLDATPPTASYPSGHTAAAIALYVGLAIVIWSLVRSAAIRALVLFVALALPVFVGLSRLYRGMHHLTDIGASVLLGCGALLLATLVTRNAFADDDGDDTDDTVDAERSRHRSEPAFEATP